LHRRTKIHQHSSSLQAKEKEEELVQTHINKREVLVSQPALLDVRLKNQSFKRQRSRSRSTSADAIKENEREHTDLVRIRLIDPAERMDIRIDIKRPIRRGRLERRARRGSDVVNDDVEHEIHPSRMEGRREVPEIVSGAEVVVCLGDV
jgi:hypothetical protein